MTSTDSRQHRDPDTATITRWDRPPTFEFTDEVDALSTVEELASELDSARKQYEHTMAYLKAAIKEAHSQADVSPTALINHSGLARQTVYTAIG